MTRKANLRLVIVVGVLLTFAITSICQAGAILFDQPTDTISVLGQTIIGTASTYEARLLFTDTFSGTGPVFTEWRSAQEDKVLHAGPNLVYGYNHPVNAGSALSVSITITPNVWHHLAYVYDGSQERLYLDGQLIGARPGSGNVGNAAGQAFIGAIFRDGSIRSGFIGYLDALRISDTARYFGSSFSPPVGDLSPDANTVLLYNFNEPPGSVSVFDESPLARTGTLGAGFSGATLPELVVDILELVALEITGPAVVAEDFQAQYKATAYFDNSSTVDVTDLADWSVEPNSNCSIETGLLTTEMVDLSMDVTITAQYSEGENTEIAQKDVSIFAICPSGSALEFDGSGDYVEVANDDSLNIPGELTISAWVKADSLPQNWGIVFKGGTGNNQRYKLTFDSEGRLFFERNTNDGYKKLRAPEASPVGVWLHVVGSYDGTYMKVYENGVEKNSINVGSNAVSYLGYPLVIGVNKYWNAYFDGLIDGVAIFDKALSAQEIQANMHRKLTGDEEGLVAYWDFDEGQGQVAGDSAGGNHGTLGSSGEADDNDPRWVDSDAPVGICSFYLMAKQHIEVAESLKQESLELLAKAIANEFLAQDLFSQMLETGEYENFEKGDIVKAKQKIHSAIQHEEQAETAVDKSLEKLDDALSALDIEQSSQ